MKNLLIIGDGRFGRFFGKEIGKAGVNVVIVDKNIDRRIISTFEAVCFAVPMSQFEDALINYKDNIACATTVFDVCSLKKFSSKLMFQYLGKQCNVIGTHPLFGPQSAKDGLVGQKIAVCNVSASESKFIEFNDFLQTVLKLRVYCCSPEYHDLQMGYSQALTHFIGHVAQRMGISRISLTTKSFDDLIDIIELVKGGSEELFKDMQTLNPHAEEAVSNFIETSKSLQTELFHH